MSIVVLVLAQILIVIGLSRLVGLAFRSLKQPQVIGEIVAGIMLGPSLLGWIAPTWAMGLFPLESIPFLNILSQIGLIFFMFLIGLELNPQYLKGNIKVAVLISHVSILVPFSLGSIIALFLYPHVSDNSVSFTAFAMFLGASLSITAFPVLARIITENNLQNSQLGTLALTCAAVDDVTAWCLLAMTIAVTRSNNVVEAVPTILLSVAYITLMLTVGRFFLTKFSTHYAQAGHMSQSVLAIIYSLVVVSALITEWIGIHLIFGAFLLGVIMPKNGQMAREIAEKTEDFVLVFLLPIFFAYSGLRTQIGLLNEPILWLLTLIVLVAAIAGKYIGTYTAARVGGFNHRDSSALGWLMNTRGLTELIVLNIGLSLGVISPLLFTILVIMALVTTFMTSPLLEWTYPKSLIRLQGVLPTTPQPTITPNYRLLVPVANPRSQKGLLELAVAIAGHGSPPAVVHPLSLILLEQDYTYGGTPVEAERLMQERLLELETLIAQLKPLSVRQFVQPIVRMTTDIARETSRIALLDRADLVIVGWHRSTFSNTRRLGGRVGQILSQTQVDVAVYVDNQKASSFSKLLVPYAATVHDDLALEIALRLLINDLSRQLIILQVTNECQTNQELSYEFSRIIDVLPKEVRSRLDIQTVCSGDDEPIEMAIKASLEVDLTLAGTSGEWGIERQTLGRYTDALAARCQSPLLITRCYLKARSHLVSVLGNPLNSTEGER